MGFSKNEGIGATSGTGEIKGYINVPSDFPIPPVSIGDTYQVLTAVVDNDPTRTNTGQSLPVGTIVWNGTDWTVTVLSEVVIDDGSNVTPVETRGFAVPNGESYFIGTTDIMQYIDTTYVTAVDETAIYYFNASGNNLNSGKYIEKSVLTPTKALDLAFTYVQSQNKPAVALNMASMVYETTNSNFNVRPNKILHAPNCTFLITSPGAAAGKNSKIVVNKLSSDGTIPSLSYDTSAEVGDSFLTALDGIYKTSTAPAALIVANDFGTVHIKTTNLKATTSSDTIILSGTNNVININVLGSVVGKFEIDTGSIVNLTCFDASQVTKSGAGVLNIFQTPRPEVNTVYVSSVGVDVEIYGQFETPYKTTSYALSQNPSNTIIVLDAEDFTENLTITTASNVSIVGKGNVNGKGAVIKGNIVLSATTANISFANLTVQPASGVPLTIGTCDGSNYFTNCKFLTAVSASVFVNNTGCKGSYEFYDCIGNGGFLINPGANFTNPPIFTIGGARSSFGVITQSYFSFLNLLDGVSDQITHTSGVLRMIQPRVLTAQTAGIVSTATAASGSNLLFGFVNLTQNDGTLKAISKTGDCNFTLGNPIYNQTGSAFTGTGTRGAQAGSINVTYSPVNYVPTGPNANQHFTGIDNRFGGMFSVSTTRPTVTSDFAHGYFKGSLMYIAGNVCPELYFCCDPTNNAAIWKPFTTNADKKFFDGSANRWTRLFVPANISFSSFSLDAYTDTARETMKFLIASSTLQIVENTLFCGINADAPQIKIWQNNSTNNFYVYVYSKVSKDTTINISDSIGLSVAWSDQGTGALPAEFGGSETGYTLRFDSSDTGLYPQKIIADDQKVAHLAGIETFTNIKAFTTGANPKYTTNPTLAGLSDLDLLNKKSATDNFIQNNSSDIGANVLYSETYTTPLTPITMSYNSPTSINITAGTAIVRNPNDPVAPATIRNFTAKTNVPVTGITTRSSSQVWIDPVTDTVDFTEAYDVDDASRIYSKINLGGLAHPVPSGSIVGLVSFNRHSKDGGLAQAFHHLAALGNVSYGIKIMPKPGDNLNLYMTQPGYIIGCFINNVLTPATPSIVTVPVIDSTVNNGMINSYYNPATGAFVQTISPNVPTQYNDVTDPITPVKAVPANKWVVTRIFVTNPLNGSPTFPAKIVCLYGQKLYSSPEMAMANAWNREAVPFLGSSLKNANAAFAIVFNNGLTTSINAALNNSPTPNAYTFGGARTNPFYF